MKGRYSSNSSIFERRGNPWVSRREGEKNFGRILETENPELDQFTRAKKAVPKPRFVDPAPAPKDTENYSLRKANALRKMNSDMNKHSHQVVKHDGAMTRFKLCPGCRHAACPAKMRCAFPFGEKK